VIVRVLRVITRHVDVGPEAETTMATSYWFNVLDYGATANGVTDDTTAIQTLTAGTRTGRGLRLPGGLHGGIIGVGRL
jgi:polygalacturonase